MPNSRVPKKDKDFNDFIRNSTKYLNAANAVPPPATNSLRLGVAATDMAAWQSWHDQWCGPTENAGVWALWTNPSAKTPTVKLQKDNIKKKFTQFATPVINSMVANTGFNETDSKTFNAKKKGVSPANPATAARSTTDSIVVSIANMGGGRMEFKCKTNHDASRASKVKGKQVQYAFQVGGTAPASADDCNKQEISTRAIIRKDFGTVNVAKTLFIFFRWYDAVHTERSGQWSAMMQAVIA